MHPCSFSNGGTINLILTLTLTCLITRHSITLQITVCSLFCTFSEEPQDILSTKSGSIVSRSAVPTIPRRQRDGTLFHQKPDTFEMSFGCDKMKSSSPVVVGDGHVLVGGCHPLQCRQVTVVCSKQKIHDPPSLNLGTPQSWVCLLRSPLHVVVVVEVEFVHQHLAKLKRTHIHTHVLAWTILTH